MVVLIPAALPTSVGPYIAVLAAGFLIGIAGHLARSRPLILTGILIVALDAAIFAFGVGKLV